MVLHFFVVVGSRAFLLDDDLAAQIYEDPEDLLEDLTEVLGLRTSGDAYKEFLYKGEPIGLIVRRLKELREAKLDKDQGLLLSLRDSGWQNPYADNWY